MKSVSNETEYKSSIKSWYEKAYDDDLASELNPESTFEDLWITLTAKGDTKAQEVYNVLGVGDSVVRERVFGHLATLLNVDYDVIYYMWLDDYSKALLALGVK